MTDPASPIYAALGAALRTRLAVIADRDSRDRDPQAHLVQLQEASGKILELAAQLPRPLPPELAHYLERCSYDKALGWIESKFPAPAC